MTRHFGLLHRDATFTRPDREYFDPGAPRRLPLHSTESAGERWMNAALIVWALVVAFAIGYVTACVWGG